MDGVDDSEETEDIQSIPTLSNADDERDVGFTTDVSDDVDLDEIAADIIRRFSLNKKQKYAFEIAIKNVIKRERKEETQQFLGYIGGPVQEKVKLLKLLLLFMRR